MKILIDARPVINQFAGVGSYVYNLLTNLFGILKDEKITVLAFSSARDVLKSEGTNYKYRFISYKYRKLYNLYFDFLKLPLADLFFGQQDLVHQTFYGSLPTIKKNTKIVSTILDLAFLSYPQFFVPNNLIVSKRALKKQLAVSHKLIAISHSTKRDLIEKCGVDPERIKVIHLGVNPPLINEGNINLAEETKNKFGIEGKYILFVSTLEPRKNIVNLIRAFSLIKDKGLKLVLAGKRGWYYDEIFAEIEKRSLKDRIIETGYVTELEKHALLSRAEMFVYPSVYEGFGIPIIEAMSYGLPVIAGNNSSMIEVVADAGFLINPFDVDQIAGKMELLLFDSDMRMKLRPTALKQAAKFSWRKTAVETLDLYREVLKR